MITDTQQILTELNTVLTSRYFRTLKNARKLLDYTVRQEISGKGGSITQRSIAIDAFGKSTDFDEQSNPQVRVEAGRLRTHLSDYYATEGMPNLLRITLPVGSYRPCFKSKNDSDDTLAITEKTIDLLRRRGVKGALLLIDSPGDGVNIGVIADDVKAGMKVIINTQSAADYVLKAMEQLMPEDPEAANALLKRLQPEVAAEMAELPEREAMH